MARVLVVGQDSENLRSLEQALLGCGHTTRAAHPVERPMEALHERPDAVLFDLTTGAAPTLVRSFLKEADLDDRVAVLVALSLDRNLELDLEIDDFFVWPGWPEEVEVRLNRVLWRRNGADPSHLIQAGDLTIDTANYRVFLGGAVVDLRYKEYELLRYLAMNPDRVLTREALLNGVWGYDYYGGVRTVDVHIRRLRSRIEDRAHTFIETVRNVGYRFHVG